MSATLRNNVRVSGQGSRTMLFAHGFGCDQNMWCYMAPSFEDRYRVVLFDHVGAGRSDLGAYDRAKYATLDGYATDVLEICDELGLEDVIFVGHSVSATVTALHRRRWLHRRVLSSGHRGAAGRARQQLSRLVGRDGPRHHGQPGPPRAGH
jgi:pimeloyl-ACP methyl ester carboxylesterase